MVQTTTILELAQQGDPTAIAGLMNQTLNPQGITARAAIKERTLKILLESSTVPDQGSLTASILRGIKGLRSEAFDRLQIFGKKSDQSVPAWTRSYLLNLNTDSEEPVDTNILTPAENLEAIASLLSQTIADDEITIKTIQEDTLLKIVVETDKFLDGQSFASKIYQKLRTADAPITLSTFETVSIYKQKLKGASFQIKSFNLVEPKQEVSEEESSDPDNAQPSSNGEQKSATQPPLFKWKNSKKNR